MMNYSNTFLTQLKKDIKTEAKSLGFSNIGFTSSARPENLPIFLDWLEKGYAASMEYLKRSDTLEKRSNPGLLLPSCETIITFALPYTPSKNENFDPVTPKISTYAIGVDYHLVIPQLLQKIVEFIKVRIAPELLEYKILTDSGPVLERELASRSGLGWIGKNSCLIYPETGSYFFLAELFLNIPFEPDVPFVKDLCGTCTRCIDNCPTEAILTNRTIDSNRCISFLTIENRQEISEHLRPKLDGWIFGCDICQQVCPWNIRFAELPEINFFQESEIITNFNLAEELMITKQEFKEKYAASPISRAKYVGYLRNLLVFSASHFSNALIEPIKKILSNVENSDLQKLSLWVLNSNNIEIPK